MADEIVYRLVSGANVVLTEDAAAKTVTVAVPGLDSKVDVGAIGQASQVAAGIIEIATAAEVRAYADDTRAITPAGLRAAIQDTLGDSTANRILMVGGFGIGGPSFSLASPDLNAVMQNGLYYCFDPLNGPLPSGVGNGWLLHERFPGGTVYATQTYTGSSYSGPPRRFFRTQVNGTWGAWVELFHSGNFDPNSKANTSGTYAGLTVGNSALLGGQSAEQLTFPGMIAYSAIPQTPTDGGWLYADGSAVSRTTYSRLFARMGTTWGAGNGSSTFNIPDLRGLFMRAADNGRGVDPSRGWGTVQSSQNLSHAHNGSTSTAGAHSHTGSTSTVGDHQHTIYGQDNDGRASGAAVNELANVENPGTASAFFSRLTGAAGGHGHTVVIDGVTGHAHTVAISSDGGNESRPINLALYAFVKY